MKKAIFGMSFNWIFALIVGGFILFLAIYGAGKFIKTSETTLYTETASKLTALLDPLETGLASGNRKSRTGWAGTGRTNQLRKSYVAQDQRCSINGRSHRRA